MIFYIGLAPSTQYRVTVRAKHLRAVGQAPPPGPPPEEAPGAYTDFRTLAKGLPDPPQVILYLLITTSSFCTIPIFYIQCDFE